MAPLATLRDDFGDGFISPCWTPFIAGSATITEATGQATITLPSSTAGAHDGEWVSKSAYDLTGDSWYINIQTMVSTAVAATAQFLLKLDATNYLLWTQVSGNVSAHKVVAGVDTSLFTVAWSATTYKYLRISESGGTITFWSSTNGTSWTSRATIAGLPFAITSLTVQFGAYCGNVASPGTFKLEDVNLILPALATNWRWTQIIWPLSERFRNVTLALDVAGTAQAYLAFSDSVDVNNDPVSPTYWAGPADGGRELTSQATQAAAQAMAVNIPTDGRFDLPTIVQGRVIRMYHRSIDGNPYTLREVYPRRLVQADDIEAEVFRGLRFEGHQFICDYLSALSANVGTLTAGVIDGVTIYAGGVTHPIRLDVNGLFLNNITTAVNPIAMLTFTNAGAGRGYLAQYDDSLDNKVVLSSGGVSGKRSIVAMETGPFDSNKDAVAYLSAQYIATIALVRATYLGATGTTKIDLSANSTFVSGGLNIGTAVGATAAGRLASSGISALNGATLDANIALSVKGIGTTTTTRGLRVTDSAGAVNFDVYDTGEIATKAGVRHNFGTYTAQSGLVINGFVTDTVNGTVRRLACV